MMQIRPSAVPRYLKGSSFYLSLNLEDDEEISVPEANLRLTSFAETESDLVHLLSTLRFWGVDSVPDDLIVLAFDPAALYFERACEQFSSELFFLTILVTLRNTVESYRLVTAASLGNVEIVKYLIARDVKSDLVTGAAAQNGHLDCLKFLHQQGWPCSKHTCSKAASEGHFECLQYLHESGCPWDMATCDYAAQNGHFKCLQYAHQHGCNFSTFAIELAAASGDVDCIQYLHQRGLPLHARYLTHVIGKQSVDGLRYLLSHGVQLTDLAVKIATEQNTVDCLQCIVERSRVIKYNDVTAETTLVCLKYLCESDAFQPTADTMALSAGDIEKMRYLHARGCPWSAEAVLLSIHLPGVGGTECIEFACEHGCPLSEACSEYAVRCGNLQILTYLHEHACPWSVSTMAMAAKCGNIACLQYAHEHGCPWDETAVSSAAGANQLQCMMYAMQHGCAVPEHLCAIAAKAGSLPCLRYAHEQGCTLPDDIPKNAPKECRTYILQHQANL